MFSIVSRMAGRVVMILLALSCPSYGQYGSTPPSVSVDECRVWRNKQNQKPGAECRAEGGPCRGTFPQGFSWGAATGAYQVEGAWNADGKGPNIWDNFTQRMPSPIADNSTGDVADNSYALYQRDVQMLRELGVKHYRFSISWSRVLPTGEANNVNQAGIDYYNRLINALVANNITPLATLYYFDVPEVLQGNFRGFLGDQIVNYFVTFARLCFQSFGDRVKHWITFNSPNYDAWFAYGLGVLAPGLTNEGVGPYLAAYHMLQAHAATWELYNQQFRATQNGQIGISILVEWFEPNSNSTEDFSAAERARQFLLGWFVTPICSADGGYPTVMKDNVDRRSRTQGLRISRLPVMTADWRNRIRGSVDFIGVNHFSTYQVIPVSANATSEILRDGDFQILCYPNVSLTATGNGVFPPGFRRALNWVRDQCPNRSIVVTENGYADRSARNDVLRINYHRSYLSELLKAMRLDGVNVFGYTVRSLMDGFEWNYGYTVRYGLYDVNFTDPSRTRTPKASATFYRNVVSKNGFPARAEKEFEPRRRM